MSVLDLRTGEMGVLDTSEANHLAWHPSDPRVLVTAELDRVTFWRIESEA